VRKDIIRKQLEYFGGVKMAPMAVQTIPTALYNFATFDHQISEGGATILIDVGAQNTDLIIVEPNSCWTRNIPLGGNAFTSTLLPPELARIVVWKKKQPWFAAAAALTAAAAIQPFIFNWQAAGAAEGVPELRTRSKQIVENARKLANEYKAAVTDTKGKED